MLRLGFQRKQGVRMKQSIYLVEDETDILELLILKLSAAGYRCRGFEKASAMLEKLDQELPDLLLLDLMLPDMDGMELCRLIKSDPKFSSLPIIMLTARIDLQDRVKGLDYGADDYITKPFEGEELLARIRAVLRRSLSQKDKNILILKPALKLDFNRFEAFIDDKRIDLTLTEFKILQIISSRPGWVFSRSQLLDQLWGTDKIVVERTIDVHIKNLRDKIGNYAASIKNVRGLGYKYDPGDLTNAQS